MGPGSKHVWPRSITAMQLLEEDEDEDTGFIFCGPPSEPGESGEWISRALDALVSGGLESDVSQACENSGGLVHRGNDAGSQFQLIQPRFAGSVHSPMPPHAMIPQSCSCESSTAGPAALLAPSDKVSLGQAEVPIDSFETSRPASELVPRSYCTGPLSLSPLAPLPPQSSPRGPGRLHVEPFGKVATDQRFVGFFYIGFFHFGSEFQGEHQLLTRLFGPDGQQINRIAEEFGAVIDICGIEVHASDGSNQLQKDQPLELQVTCNNFGRYVNALDCIAARLKDLYFHYEAYCHSLGRSAPGKPFRFEELQRDDLGISRSKHCCLGQEPQAPVHTSACTRATVPGLCTRRRLEPREREQLREAQFRRRREARQAPKEREKLGGPPSLDEFSWSVFMDKGMLHIHMEGQGLDDAGVERWCKWAHEHLIERSTGLGALREESGFLAVGDVDFSNNCVGDRGLHALVLCLLELRVTIRTIKLFKNFIGRAGGCSLADWLASAEVAPLEVHLSHNFIPREGVLDILGALAQNASFPPERPGVGTVPLWLRLERNMVADPDEVLVEGELMMRNIRTSSEVRARTCGMPETPMLCAVQAQTPKECGRDYCARQAKGHGCPLVHLTYFTQQRSEFSSVPPQALAWNAEQDKEEQVDCWRICTPAEDSLLPEAYVSAPSKWENKVQRDEHTDVLRQAKLLHRSSPGAWKAYVAKQGMSCLGFWRYDTDFLIGFIESQCKWDASGRDFESGRRLDFDVVAQAKRLHRSHPGAWRAYVRKHGGTSLSMSRNSTEFLWAFVEATT